MKDSETPSGGFASAAHLGLPVGPVSGLNGSMRTKLAWLTLCIAAILSGCRTADKKAEEGPWARFYMESSSAGAVLTQLPLSEVKLSIAPKPVLTEFDITNVELVQVELGRCLLFQFTGSAARDLYRMTVAHQGKRLVLIVDGSPLGVRRIDGPVSDGNLMLFVEMPDSALPELQAKLKKSAATIKKLKRD